MGIDDLFFPVPPAKIRMHHPSRDRSGPDDAHFDHDVVVVSGFQAGEHRHLRPALDLKNADGIRAADHLERGLVAIGNIGHGDPFSVVFLDRIERPVQHGEHSEPQQIDFEKPERFDVLFVPLDHRAVGHGRVLDGDDLADRFVSQEKPAGVDRKVTREILYLFGETRQVLVHRVLRIEPGAVEGFARDVVVVREELGDAIQGRVRDLEDFSHFANGRARAVAHDVRHHRRVRTVVFLVDVLDDFLAAVVLDIEIDVRRFGALPRDESLEQKIHLHGIDGGDSEAVADGGVRRRASSLTENSLTMAELDDFPHRQKIPVVLEFVDERKLLFELGDDVLRYAAGIPIERVTFLGPSNVKCRSHSDEVFPSGSFSEGYR